MFDALHLKMHAACEWPWRSFKVITLAAIWYALYDFLLVFHCKCISILHRFRDINTYLANNKDVTWPWPRPLGGQFIVTRLILLDQTVHKIWGFYVHPLQRNLRACKILKWITWPGPRPFQGQLAFRRLKFDIACKGTKFDDSSFSRSRDISSGVKF